MKIDALPFYIGVCESPSNPAGLPSTMPFTLGIDNEIGAISQLAGPGIIEVLDRAYFAGQLIGTPLSETLLGKPYADDFIRFIASARKSSHLTALEIGAGVGYITRRLLDAGWKATGLEPGRGYASHWKRFNVDVVNDFYPSVQTPGPYDLICSYAVLEHISKPVEFLRNVREKLSVNGIVVFAVPDCTEEIIAGDPGILLHEHFTYFNKETLISLFQQAGLKALVKNSGYGRSLYVLASREDGDSKTFIKRNDLTLLSTYPYRAKIYIDHIREFLKELSKTKTIGLYCPSRALSVIHPGIPMRFFDDDISQQGKYIPPFAIPIESQSSLLATPVDTLLIMSRTFGEQIRNRLQKAGYKSTILIISEVLKA